MTRQEAILEALRTEDCLAAHQIAQKLGMTLHYSTPRAKEVIAEIESDLEALAAADPPQVSHDLREYNMRTEGGRALRRCWRLADAR
ncbi:MAG: hypothetical protein OXI26_10180 [bacterium]|nr:hypothetical protein [bacterium]